MDGNRYTIVHVSTELGWRGGEQQVKLLTDGLAARGHKCVVLSPPRGALYQDRQRVGMAEPLRYFGEFDIFAASRLANLAKKIGADLIHAHTSHAHSLAWLATHRLAIPAVVARRVDFRVGGNRLSRRKYFASGVHYIAISEAVRDVLAESGIDSQRVAIVHSGIDTSRFPQREGPRNDSAAKEFGAVPEVPLIANVAALTDHKDQATLLRAAARLRDRGVAFRLVIAGGGELEVPLKSQCSQLGLQDRVLFAGHISDLRPLYSAADLFVMSSHMEGLCTSILDAMWIGIPVVAMRTGGIPEIVEDGSNGLLAMPRDADGLADALEKVLRNPTMAENFAAEGRKTVLQKFTADRMVEGTIAAYREILTTQRCSLAEAKA